MSTDLFNRFYMTVCTVHTGKHASTVANCQLLSSIAEDEITECESAVIEPVNHESGNRRVHCGAQVMQRHRARRTNDVSVQDQMHLQSSTPDFIFCFCTFAFDSSAPGLPICVHEVQCGTLPWPDSMYVFLHAAALSQTFACEVGTHHNVPLRIAAS